MRIPIIRRAIAVAATATICITPMSASAAAAEPSGQTTAAATQAEPGGGPADHLREARQLLNQVLTVPVSGKVLERLAELRTAYIDLERAWAAAAGSPITETPPWASHQAAIDRAISDLLAMAATPDAEPVGTTGATGTDAVTATSEQSGAIDATMAGRLREFQRHLRAFNEAALATKPPPSVRTTTTPGTPPPPAAAVPENPAPAERTDTLTGSSASQPPAGGTPAPQGEILALLNDVEALLMEMLPSPSGTTDPAASVNVTLDRARLEQLLRRVIAVRAGIR